jgi:Winged helix DNA-binding domain
MNAIETEPCDLAYSSPAPVLIGATSETALSRAVRMVGAAGCRIADAVTLDRLCERIDRQIAASAVWLELDRDCGSAMDEILERISSDTAHGLYSAVVSTSAELIDPVAARLKENAVQLIVDAGDSERAAALAVAAAFRTIPQRLSDIASDQNAARLRQLSDEVSRIAATLARLSAGPTVSAPALEPVHRGDGPEISVETVRGVIRARRLRSRYFPEDLFADPAWDMLLDLLQAEISHLRVPVSSLCIAAAVPATTALRWLKAMVGQGLFVRRADPHDGRRVFVELAPEASSALRRYFAEVGAPAVV